MSVNSSFYTWIQLIDLLTLSVQASVEEVMMLLVALVCVHRQAHNIIYYPLRGKSQWQ